MPTLFISYRRADSMESTGRIYDRLVDCFGPQNVFRDIDSIPLGIPFPQLLTETLSRTDLVIVVIGPCWASAVDGNGQQRLANAEDFVRIEVEAALKRNIPVIPVIVSNAKLPSPEELPEPLHALCERNAFPARPDPDFHNDVDRLCVKIQEVLGLSREAVRRSEMVDAKIAELTTENLQLKAEVDAQQSFAELLRIDHEWQAELEKYKVTSGKNSPPKIPTEADVFWSIVFAIGGAVFSVCWISQASEMGAPDYFGMFGFVMIVFCIWMPIGQSIAYKRYTSAYDAYQRRRSAALVKRGVEGCGKP